MADELKEEVRYLRELVTALQEQIPKDHTVVYVALAQVDDLVGFRMDVTLPQNRGRFFRSCRMQLQDRWQLKLLQAVIRTLGESFSFISTGKSLEVFITDELPLDDETTQALQELSQNLQEKGTKFYLVDGIDCSPLYQSTLQQLQRELQDANSLRKHLHPAGNTDTKDQE